MSIYTEGVREDKARERTIFLTNADKDLDGRVRYRVLPWYNVILSDNKNLFEPADCGTVSRSSVGTADSLSSDKHPTRIEFVDEREFIHRDAGQILVGGHLGTLLA